MSLYIRVYTSFYSHRKTIRLKSIIGNDAYWIPPRLWAYAANNQPDGKFIGYSPEELSECIGYHGDASSMLQALLQAGFLDEDMSIHDWKDYNGYHTIYAERAKVAAKARWEKERTKERVEETGTEKRGNERSIASSMLQASPPDSLRSNGNGKTLPKTIREIDSQIKDLEEDMEKIKAKGGHLSPTGFEWCDKSKAAEWSELNKRKKELRIEKRNR